MSFQYQLFPELTQEEFAALKESIRERGVLVPVELDEAGNILDGHHRIKAWTELKSEGVKLADYPRIVRKFEDEADKRNHIRTINIVRRHLTKEQVIPHWEEMKRDGMTYQAIADVSGVSHMTVHRALENSTLTNVKVPSSDGRIMPVKYKPRAPQVSIFANTRQQEEQAKQAAATIEDAPDGKILDTKRGARIAREQEAERKRNGSHVESLVETDLQILIGDFREIAKQIPDGSIDLIFTDPPYPKEYLPLWSDLSGVAARVLKPGGLLIAYSGQLYLPEVMYRLSECLQYVWLGSIFLKGPHNEVQARNIHNHSKPLLFYSKGSYKRAAWFSDTFFSEGKDKDYHDWQQAEGAATYYIETLTGPGDTIFEPFLGGGTTAAAAVKLNRSFIGCDIDAMAVQATLERTYGTGRTI